STPDQTSTPASGSFPLEHNATVRAIGYRADGLQSEEADSITATVYSHHTLTVTVTGGSTVFLNPSGPVYNNTDMVTLTAVSQPGCSFLFWQDGASGTSNSVTLSMEYDRSVGAVFGTNLPSNITAPALAWATNIGAGFFAVDEKTNVYS